jgi:tetratricopeptide (TPR) repeat protein
MWHKAVFKQAIIVILAAVMTVLSSAIFAQNIEAESSFEEMDLFAMLDPQTKKLYSDAIEVLNRGEKTLAMMHMEKALARIAKDDPRYKIVLKGAVICYQQVALYHYNYDDKADAIYYFNKIILAVEKYNDKFFAEKADESYAYLGKIYHDKGNKKKANNYLNILKNRDTTSAPYWRDQLAEYLKSKQPAAK